MEKIGTKTKIESASLCRSSEVSLKGNFTHVIGIDEAGRGPLAGPVVAAACYVSPGVEKNIAGIMDSKALTKEKDREHIYEKLISTPGVCWGVSVVDHVEIDNINILQATLRGMTRATRVLLDQPPMSGVKGIPPDSCTNATSRSWGGNTTNMSSSSNSNSVDGSGNGNGNGDGSCTLDPAHCLALVDGNKTPDDLYNTTGVEGKFVIKGDSFVFSIAAASIIAKVTRDRIMKTLDKLYPMYGLGQHKGYPTSMHREMLNKFGPCPVHRLTYAPVAKCINRSTS
jgi:ribonuclease HII